jgi:hypothetical protein
LYLTANDDRSYVVDMLHFHHMARHAPGVRTIEVVIVVSAVKEFSAADRRAIDWLVADASSCPWLKFRTVIWKGNVGRDFSSAAAGLRALAGELAPTDFVMVRNRSGYGPFEAGWYQRFIDQYRRHPGTALTGSTLCLRGHPKLPSEGPCAHVQTYVYLSQWQQLRTVSGNFPGARAPDRLQTIVAGEIGLSRRFLQAGARISCLHWPEQAFDLEQVAATPLPRADFKSEDLGVPIRYKYPAYRRRLSELGLRARWWLRQVRATETEARALHQQCHDYDAEVESNSSPASVVQLWSSAARQR